MAITPFAPSHAVPIVGQAFTLLEVVPVTVLICNCEAKKTISVAGLNAPAQCPACKRVYSVQSVECALNPMTGRKTFNASIAMAVPRPDLQDDQKPVTVS